MANHTVGGYSQNSFYVTSDGQLMLDPDFDASEDAIRYDITDDRDTDNGDNDTNRFDGDAVNNESGDDPNQNAIKYDAQGNPIASGRVYLEESWTLTDGNGNVITLYKVESGGIHSGWVADGPIIPGVAYAYSGPNNIDGNNSPRYTDLHDPTEDPDDANARDGGVYADDIRTGAQNDTVYGNDGDDQIKGGEGDDNLYGGDGSDTIDGGDGNDYIAYGRGGDSVRGGAGNDTIDEAAGDPDYDYDDTIDAGDGDDKVYAGWGDDYVQGGAGDDELHGSEGDDTLQGDAGNDTLYGGDGQDALDGGDGRDLIYAGAGNDTVDGGADNDTIFGEDGNDLLRGGAGDDVIDGGDGDDTIDGGVDNDALTGGAGNDRIDGGSGQDTLTGGSGDDTFVTSQNSATTITDFDVGDDDGNGAYNDQLDVSELRTPDGRAIHVHDVVVTDDGNGNAKLTFPEGETIVLQGVSPAQMSSTSQLNAAGIPCFTAGTRIATARGQVPVEQVKVGDRVQTRDNGLRRVRWIGHRVVGPQELAIHPMLRPIHIAPGTFGNSEPLRLSAQHGIALETPGGAPHLVRAGHLARMRGGGVRVAQGVQAASYYHLLLDSHDLILAEGVACESFYPGPWGLVSIGPAAARDLVGKLPGLGRLPVTRSYGPTAHPVARFGRLPTDIRDLRSTG